jgi:hypothetical protein
MRKMIMVASAAAAIAAVMTASAGPAEARARLVPTNCQQNNDGRTVCPGTAATRQLSARRRYSYQGPRAHARKGEVRTRAASGCPAHRRVVSRKTGKVACVGARYRARFQSYVDDVEAHGAAIYYMGGYRRGRCSSRHMHSCGGGMAIDLCQDWRGHVSGKRDCHLPRPAELATIAARHGLFEGGLWCNSDYGHAQVGVTASRCRHRPYAAGSWGHGHRGTYVARGHHRHHRHHRARVARR